MSLASYKTVLESVTNHEQSATVTVFIACRTHDWRHVMVSVVGLISEVNQHWAQLLVGW